MKKAKEKKKQKAEPPPLQENRMDPQVREKMRVKFQSFPKQLPKQRNPKIVNYREHIPDHPEISAFYLFLYTLYCGMNSA